MNKMNFAVALCWIVLMPVSFACAQTLNMDTLDLDRTPPAEKQARGNAFLLCVEPLFVRDDKQRPVCSAYTQGLFEIDSSSDTDRSGTRYVHSVSPTYHTLKGQVEEWKMSFSVRELNMALKVGTHTDTIQYSGNKRATFHISGRDGDGHYVNCAKATGEFKVLEANYAKVDGSWQVKPTNFAVEFSQSCLNSDSTRPSIRIYGAFFYNAILPTKVDPPKVLGQRLNIQFGKEVAVSDEAVTSAPTNTAKPKIDAASKAQSTAKRKSLR